MERGGEQGASNWADEPRLDTRRYLGALKRSRVLITVIVAVLTLGVLVVSLVLPKQYTATATIVFNPDTGLFGPPDAASTQRQLSTIGTLITTPRTSAEAARRVPGETAASVESATSTSVDEEANLIHVGATSNEPELASRIANAVSGSFLFVQRKLQRERLLGAKAGLEEQIAELSGQPGSEEQIEAIRNRINHLGVQAASAGTDLQLAEAARPPSSPSSPQPLRNTIIAFFAAIFIGVLIALARDQLAPGLSDPREVSRLLRAPVLAGIPYVGKRVSRNRAVASAVEHEAYQTLSASVQAMLPQSEGPRIVLITSAVHAEGKSTATSRLGRALAQAGHKTLLISGDLRWPELHRLFNASRAPGLTDLLERVAGGEAGGELMQSMAQAVSLPTVNGRPSAELHLLTSGTPADDPSGMLSSGVAGAFFEYLRRCDYAFVLIDGPPSLGIADIQPLSKLADDIIVVSRLDRVKVADMVNLQEMLYRFGAEPFGVVVIGAQVDASPYYLSERRALIESQPVTDEAPRPLSATDSPEDEPAPDSSEVPERSEAPRTGE